MGLSLTISANQTASPPMKILTVVQSIKTDIGKPFDKSITIDNSNLNVIDFINQSIEIDTQNHRRSFKVLNLSIYRFYRFH